MQKVDSKWSQIHNLLLDYNQREDFVDIRQKMLMLNKAVEEEKEKEARRDKKKSRVRANNRKQTGNPPLLMTNKSNTPKMQPP
jgi:hypothetical protein